MVNNVAVIGIGQTKFGELWGEGLRNLGVDAGMQAISNAGVERDDVQALYVGCMAPGMLTGQEHVASLFADHLGLVPKPAIRCEAACASGSVALRQAYLAVRSGELDICLVLGAEKMTDVKGDAALTALIGAGDYEWEANVGLTFTGLYALMARAHMAKYGTTREQMAMVSVNNHENGIKNPLAQFRSKISVDDVLKSSLIADPLRTLDCSPLTDGAAAVVIASEHIAKRCSNPIWIKASSQASDIMALHDRPSLTSLRAVSVSGSTALRQAGMNVSDIDVLEVHDCFSINEILCLESLGFCKEGWGGKFVESGGISIDGEIPTNTQGGLKSIGHPVGATGIRQVVDICRVLRNSACNHVNNSENGMTCNVGGVGGTAVVHILGRDL